MTTKNNAQAGVSERRVSSFLRHLRDLPPYERLKAVDRLKAGEELEARLARSSSE